MAMRVAVIDDDPDARAYVARLIENWPGGAAAETFPSGDALLFDGRAFEAYVIDIQMPGMDGMTLARTLRARRSGCVVVFLTAFPDWASEGYEVDALRYLLKPVRAEKLYDALDAAANRLLSNAALLVKTEAGDLRVPIGEICFVESRLHYARVAAKREDWSVREPMGALEARLGGGFARCHRSYLVSLSQVKRIGKTEIELDDGRTLPLSRRLSDSFARAFARHYREGKA